MEELDRTGLIGSQNMD